MEGCIIFSKEEEEEEEEKRGKEREVRQRNGRCHGPIEARHCRRVERVCVYMLRARESERERIS